MATYLGFVNLLGFILYIINILLYKYTADSQIDFLITLTSFAGGSAGIILAIILFDRKSEKDNMLSRVFVVCIFIIQIILYFIFKGEHIEKLKFSIWQIFENNKLLLYYLGIINFITFTIFALDKLNAVQHKYRYRIITLLSFCFAGGSIGGLLAMYIFRHKTQKDYFTIGIPLIIIMHIFVAFYFINK